MNDSKKDLLFCICGNWDIVKDFAMKAVLEYLRIKQHITLECVLQYIADGAILDI